jgi:hypothetical protein
MKRFRREQTEISRLAAELTDRFKVLSPQADHIDAQAAMAALEGSEQIKAGETVKAAASAGIAAQKLGALVRRLSAENESRRDTGGRFRRGGKESNVAVRGSALQEPEQVLAELTGATRVKREFLVKDTEDLAARQRHLGSQMQAFAANLPKDVVADRQQDINERTVELANGVQLIREHAELLIRNPEGRKAARVAVSQIAKARRHQQRAQRMISIRAPGKAASPQRTAAAALEAAAKALERLGQLLSEEIDDLEPTEPEAQLAAAFEAADRAARSEKLSDVDLAAQLLDALARQAAAGAQRMGLSPWAADGILEAMIAGMSSMFGTGAMATDLSEAQLKAMGITYLDWARLPGTLRDEILRGPERSGPEEYRQLIKRYFQEIARRGGMEPKGKK